MTTVQVPKSLTWHLRRLQVQSRQPFYELILQRFGLLADGSLPAEVDDPP